MSFEKPPIAGRCHGSMAVEIVLRWGSTLLDVVRAEDFSIAGTDLVRAGEPLAAPVGAVGPIAYELRDATPVAALPTPRGDRRVLPYLAAIGIIHVAIAMSALSISLDPAVATTAQPRSPRRARIAPAPDLRGSGADDRGRADQGQARAMIGAAGAAGAASEKARPRGHVTIANTGELPQLSRAEAVERARHAGILGTTHVSADAFASLVGPDSVTSGFDARMAEAAFADTAGTSAGDGSARSGFGGGGGGNAGTIGLGLVGFHSDGTSSGHGWGGRAPATVETRWIDAPYDYTPMSHGRLGRGRPPIRICDGDLRARCRVEGVLDEAVVRRHVRRRYAQLAYCFERYTVAHPVALHEPLELEFDVDTQVLAVTATGAPAEVADCAVEAIRGAAFPPGATHVLYYIASAP